GDTLRHRDHATLLARLSGEDRDRADDARGAPEQRGKPVTSQNREHAMGSKWSKAADYMLVFQFLLLMTSKFFVERFLRACSPSRYRSAPSRTDVTASCGVEG